MQKQFNLILTNYWKSTLSAVASIGFFMLGLASDVLLINYFHLPGIGLVLFVLVLLGTVFLSEILARKFSVDSALVTIDDAGLSVQRGAASPPRRIAFADIDSYYFDLINDFHVQPRHGQKLKLHLNQRIHPQGLGPFMEMRQHFEYTVAKYQALPGVPPIRRLTFFSRPVGTFWLVACAGLVAWLGWRAGQPQASEGDWGGFVLTGMGLVVYALLWHRARRKTRG